MAICRGEVIRDQGAEWIRPLASLAIDFSIRISPLEGLQSVVENKRCEMIRDMLKGRGVSWRTGQVVNPEQTPVKQLDCALISSQVSCLSAEYLVWRRGHLEGEHSGGQ